MAKILQMLTDPRISHSEIHVQKGSVVLRFSHKEVAT